MQVPLSFSGNACPTHLNNVIGIYSESLQNAEEDSLRLVESLKRLSRRDFRETGNSGLISRH